MTGSGPTPRFVAIFIWYAGAAVLTVKGALLLRAAVDAGLSVPAAFGICLAGAGIGAARGRWFFGPVCQRNLTRIASLPAPQFWHAFRPGFWAALVVMILAGSFLSRWAQGRPMALIGVSALDLGVAAALWVGGMPFWRLR